MIGAEDIHERATRIFTGHPRLRGVVTEESIGVEELVDGQYEIVVQAWHPATARPFGEARFVIDAYRRTSTDGAFSVDERYRRRGFGSALRDARVELCDACGIPTIVLNDPFGSVAARRFNAPFDPQERGGAYVVDTQDYLSGKD